MIKFMKFMNKWEFMHIWTNFWKFHSYMHEFPLVHKIHKFDHGDNLVIMAMTGCWSFMLEYIIMSSWNIQWPLYMGIAQKPLDTHRSVDFLYVSKIPNVEKKCSKPSWQDFTPTHPFWAMPIWKQHISSKRGFPHSLTVSHSTSVSWVECFNFSGIVNCVTESKNH